MYFCLLKEHNEQQLTSVLLWPSSSSKENRIQTNCMLWKISFILFILPCKKTNKDKAFGWSSTIFFTFSLWQPVTNPIPLQFLSSYRTLRGLALVLVMKATMTCTTWVSEPSSFSSSSWRFCIIAWNGKKNEESIESYTRILKLDLRRYMILLAKN